MTNDPFPKELVAAAERMREAVNIHVVASLALDKDKPGYVAIRLDDGRSPDGTLYDSRADATRHCGNINGGGVTYIKVGRETMPLREAILVLQMNRKAFTRGVVFTEEEVVTPHLSELTQPFIPNTFRKLRRGGLG